MKIAWFTPLSQRSAIARFSVAVTAQLSQTADVDVVCFDAEGIRASPTSVRRFRSAEEVRESALRGYDLAIYNFGNYLPFHKDIYLVAKRWPGICILHDFVMHHFFAGYYLDERRDPSAYEHLLERTYGRRQSAGERIWETDQVVQLPLFEEVIRGALGVITHSDFFKTRVQECFAGPVASIPLAYDARAEDPETSRSKLGLRSDQLLAVTVGHINPNKEIERVIRAFARLGLATNSLTYAVVGPASPEYELKLKTIVREVGPCAAVRFVGPVSDQMLSAYLSAADFCVNLRFPAMEGASASAIEEMLLGKPVVVTNTGFFSELPDDCVIKIAPADDAGLTNAFKKLLSDPAFRGLLGGRAKAFAETKFTAHGYAKRVLEFAFEVQSMKPLLALADSVAIELGRMGAAAESPLVDRFAREIASTFGSKDSEAGSHGES